MAKLPDITVVIDTREKAPLRFSENTESGSLYSGDYSIKGYEDIFAVERKSLADLTGSLSSGRDRFQRELHRLRGYRFKRLLIVASKADAKAKKYRSQITPASVFGSVQAFEVRYDIPVIWEPSELNAARLVEQWGKYFVREHLARQRSQ
ncbi:MAG: ERCC4 domain-containing protein [Verrucomicrobiota bacterium]